jgi:carboxyl-terminal processing protease
MSKEMHTNYKTFVGQLIGMGILAMAPVFCVDAQTSLEDPPDSASTASSGSAQLTLDDLRTFTDVFNQLRRNYVEEVEDKTLLEAAINGMLLDLDPHSAYLPAEDLNELDNTSRGQYVGIGVDVAAEKGRIVVKTVITPSPANTAGMNPGDRITSVDKKAVKGRPLQQSIDQLTGKPGTQIELEVQAPGEDSRTIVMTRQHVKLPTLSFRLLEKHFAYFNLSYFHRETATDLKAALDSILSEGTVLKGIILDLRDNPGGVLQPAIEIADGFLDHGSIVTTRGRNASMQMDFSAKQGQWVPDIPLVLLVDRGSASASEVLAGALQDNQRALIVGERTFGKGSVQSVLPLRNGAGIKLTTARYYTPSGKSIQAEGIIPDVLASGKIQVLDVTDNRKQEIDLERHLEGESKQLSEDQGEVVDIEEDYPLHEALNLLRSAQIFAEAPKSNN